MKNTLARLIVFFILLGSCSKPAFAAGGTFSTFASWGIDGRALASSGFVPVPEGTSDIQQVTDPKAVATVASKEIDVNTPDSESGGGIIAKAEANAAMGVMGVQASATAFGLNWSTGGTVHASATAGMLDTWTLDSTDTNVQGPLHIAAAFKLSGSMRTDINGEYTNHNGFDYINSIAMTTLSITGAVPGANPAKQIILPGPYINNWYGYYEDQVDSGNLPEDNVHFHGDAPTLIFVNLLLDSFHTPTLVDFIMSVDATATTVDTDLTNGMTGYADTFAGYDHTALWQGITSVTDGNGVPLSNWTLTSASGFDWTHAAVEPEPASALMLLMIAPYVVLRRRRARPET